MEHRRRVGLLKSHRILVGSDSLLRVVDTSVAVGQFQGSLPAQGLVLRLRLRVGLLVLVGSIIVFTQGIELVTLTHSRIGSTSCDEETDQCCIYDCDKFAHTLL